MPSFCCLEARPTAGPPASGGDDQRIARAAGQAARCAPSTRTRLLPSQRGSSLLRLVDRDRGLARCGFGRFGSPLRDSLLGTRLLPNSRRGHLIVLAVLDGVGDGGCCCSAAGRPPLPDAGGNSRAAGGRRWRSSSRSGGRRWWRPACRRRRRARPARPSRRRSRSPPRNRCRSRPGCRPAGW